METLYELINNSQLLIKSNNNNIKNIKLIDISLSNTIYEKLKYKNNEFATILNQIKNYTKQMYNLMTNQFDNVYINNEGRLISINNVIDIYSLDNVNINLLINKNKTYNFVIHIELLEKIFSNINIFTNLFMNLHSVYQNFNQCFTAIKNILNPKHNIYIKLLNVNNDDNNELLQINIKNIYVKMNFMYEIEFYNINNINNHAIYKLIINKIKTILNKYNQDNIIVRNIFKHDVDQYTVKNIDKMIYIVNFYVNAELLLYVLCLYMLNEIVTIV